MVIICKDVKAIRYLFELKAKPVKGLLAVEWVVLGYTLLTLLLMLFTFTKVHNPVSMFVGRVQAVAITLALWGVYRMLPCRLTHFARIGVQLALLSWWYPDTYEFNRMFANLDHLFAGYEQALFGCQPALTFAQEWSHPVWSELMHLHLLRHLYLPARCWTAVLLCSSRYRQYCRRHIPRFRLLLCQPSGDGDLTRLEGRILLRSGHQGP